MGCFGLTGTFGCVESFYMDGRNNLDDHLNTHGLREAGTGGALHENTVVSCLLVQWTIYIISFLLYIVFVLQLSWIHQGNKRLPFLVTDLER